LCTCRPTTPTFGHICEVSAPERARCRTQAPTKAQGCQYRTGLASVSRRPSAVDRPLELDRARRGFDDSAGLADLQSYLLLWKSRRLPRGFRFRLEGASQDVLSARRRTAQPSSVLSIVGPGVAAPGASSPIVITDPPFATAALAMTPAGVAMRSRSLAPPHSGVEVDRRRRAGNGRMRRGARLSIRDRPDAWLWRCVGATASAIALAPRGAGASAGS
jgi:hypothetical protein